MERVEGQRIGGKYTLIRPLASGGMGALWVARHDTLGTEVAVKFIRAQWADDSTAMRRFRREARATAQLESAHVPRIYDYGLDDQTPFIAMELFKGMSLRELLDREGRLTTARVGDIITQIARALTEAHAAGIVHRDLKPRNIFVAQVAGLEVVKVLDFGVAKLTSSLDKDHPTLGDDATMTGALIGSPAYMSPEQARGGDVDFRSDVWSLATIAFEALTGRRAFVGRNVGDLIAAVTGDPLPVPSDVCASLSAAHDALMERALARNPAARFQSAAALAVALTELATQDEVIAPAHVRRREPSLGRTITTMVEPIGVVDETGAEVAAETALDATVEAPAHASPPVPHAESLSDARPARAAGRFGAVAKTWYWGLLAALAVGGAAFAPQLRDRALPRMQETSLRSSSITTNALAPTARTAPAGQAASSASAPTSAPISAAPTSAPISAAPTSAAPRATVADTTSQRAAPRAAPAPSPARPPSNKPKVDPFFGVP